MTVQSGPGGYGTRHIRSDWPITEGLNLGTNKLPEKDGLEAEHGSHVRVREKELI